MNTTVSIDPLGDVLFARSRRAKRVSISIRPFRGVRVAVPWRMSLRKAEVFLWEHLEWVKANLERMRKIEVEHAATLSDQPAIDRAEAKAVLTGRLRELAEENGFSYNRVFIRNQKTRWGSCSHLNNISLNINLVRLTDELRDYVILHELVHTQVKSHSKRFWAELENYINGAKMLDRKLKKHQLGLY